MDKKVLIKNYGCQMNIYDSECMLESLGAIGYKKTDDFKEANLVILNTCYIREKSSEKIFSDLGRLKKIQDAHKKCNKSLMIGVTGCLSQAEGHILQKRAPYVNIILGTQTTHRITQIVEKIHNATSIIGKYKLKNKINFCVVDTEFPIKSKFDYLDPPKAKGVSAFITIQEGCDKFCHFCVVPYTRGIEISRPIVEIIREVTILAKQGVREIILLGQNVNAYSRKTEHNEEENLPILLEKMGEIEDLKRIRYITSHPKDMSRELIDEHKNNQKLMPYLHLPIQSGSDKILKSMNRKHTVKEYLDIISSLRKVRPDLALSSDFIVGYPGETEKDFAETIKLIKYVKFAQSYSFKYSERPGTTATILGNQINEKVKSERLEYLQGVLTKQQKAFNKSLVGSIQKILIERIDKKSNQKVGLSPYLQSTYFEDYGDKFRIGDIVDVHITDYGLKSLKGRSI
jgi:tRNA-2-methylthio-N6-dimethylallyladenosine synthase